MVTMIISYLIIMDLSRNIFSKLLNLFSNDAQWSSPSSGASWPSAPLLTSPESSSRQGYKYWKILQKKKTEEERFENDKKEGIINAKQWGKYSIGK
jgi:hypothetical protein